MIIPELEAAAKKFPGFAHAITWTDDEKDTLLRYYRNVPTKLLKKYIPRHSIASFGTMFRALKKKEQPVKESPKPAAEPEKKKPAKERKQQARTKLERIAEINKKPDGRKSNRPSTTGTGWTDEEKAAIDGCKDKAAAIAAYRAKFPDSKRNDNSIYMKWHDMDIRARKKKRWDAPENNEAKPSSQAIASSNEVKEPPASDIKIAGAEGLSDALPESNPTNSEQRNAHLRTGDKVKHINPRGLFAGIGTVKRANLKSGELLVAFDNGMEWLPEKELAPVTS